MIVPSPGWLAQTYGIEVSGEFHPLQGAMAHVYRLRDQKTNASLVLRLSDSARIDEVRLERVHQFQAYLRTQNVLTVCPLKTQDGQTLAKYRDVLVEVFPYIEGRKPQRGNRDDIRRVAEALAKFHNAGVQYTDLPGEETCDQNHVALERLRQEIRYARALAEGKSYESLFLSLVDHAEELIDRLQSLRPHLVETGLHLDASPENMILSPDGRMWFIDCSHTVRGRRVFDVATCVYYCDSASQAAIGDPVRYGGGDPIAESELLRRYQSVCEPSWQEQEEDAYTLEYRLMLVHGAVYRVTASSERDIRMDLEGFLRSPISKNAYPGHDQISRGQP